MKSIKRIVALFTIVAGIIVFWLAPGINKAGNETYTRVYEDTDHVKESALVKVQDTTKKPHFSRIKPSGKKLKTESIKSGTKLSKIKPSMFSRSIQFEKERGVEGVVVEQKLYDSFILELSPVDTTKEIVVTKKIDL